MIQKERSIFWEVIVFVILRKKIHMSTCLILNGYWDTAVWIYKHKNNVNGNKREITVNLILMLIQWLNNELVTRKWQICYSSRVQKTYHQLQCTLQFMYEHCVFFDWANLHISLWVQLHPKCKQFILCAHKPCSSPNPIHKNLTHQTKKRDKQCAPDPNSSISVTFQN